MQYNLAPPAQKLCYAANRKQLNLDVFADPSTRTMLRADLIIVSALDAQIKSLENSQYNLPVLPAKLSSKANRKDLDGIVERFPHESVQRSIRADLTLLDA